MTKPIKQIVTNLVDAWNSHDVERVAQFYAPDYQGTDVGQATAHQGLTGIRQAVTRYLHAFPDLQITREETVIQGNQVAVSWTACGTHRGKLMNIPPTDRKVSVRGISMLTVKDGKIAGALYLWDVAGLLRAIGLLPDLPM